MGDLGVMVFWGESMKYDLNYCVDEYIALCSRLCRKPEDYTKEKVAMHNKCMKKLNALKKDMYTDVQLTECVYSVLLNHKDIYVQQSAATDCLTLNIHISKAIGILKWIIQHGDRMSAMGAKRTLLIWEGKIRASDPF